MAILKGQNFRLFVGGKCCAASTTASIHLAANLEEISTKDSTNSWQEQECVSKSWDASVEGLIAIEADSAANTGWDLVSLIGEIVTVKFDITNGDKNRESETAKYEGIAVLNDVSISAANKSNVTYSAQLTGTGELTKATA